MSLLTNVLVGTVGKDLDGDGIDDLVIEIRGSDNGDDTYTLTATVVTGYADLRGFFLDTDADDSNDTVTYAGSRSNNMEGSGETFDEGYEIGTQGIGTDDISTWSHTFTGSLYDLDNLDFGIRATSVGGAADSREDSVKLVGQFDIPEPPPPPPVTDHFPTFDKDISHITLYFDTTAGDVAGTSVTTTVKGKTMTKEVGDGYYTVKIDGWIDQAADGSDDLDAYLAKIMEYLVANDPNVGEGTVLLGVAIKGGDVDHGGYNNYYAMDGDSDADNDQIPTGALVENKHLDMSYNYSDVFGTA